MESKVKYSGSHLLFTEFQNLHWRVQGLGAITQNSEMEITPEEYAEWCGRAQEVQKELEILINKCIIIVNKGEVIREPEKNN